MLNRKLTSKQLKNSVKVIYLKCSKVNLCHLSGLKRVTGFGILILLPLEKTFTL